MVNHLIDPSYFDDLIAEFAFEYDWYFVKGAIVDDMGNRKYSYGKTKIVGSLQDNGTYTDRRKDGNITYHRYKFYFSSQYKLDRNDIIFYNNQYLLVNEDIEKYDEYGVRSCSLVSVDKSLYRDLLEVVKDEVLNRD